MTYLTAHDVKQRYHISDMTLWRYLRDEEKDFPKPLIIGRRRLFNEEELTAWERKRAVESAE